MASSKSLIDFVTFGRELQGGGWHDPERLRARLGDSDQYRWMGAEESAWFSFAGGTERRVRIECSMVNIVHPSVLPPLRVLIDDVERPYTLQIGAHPPFILTVTGERNPRTVTSRFTILAPVRKSAHDIGAGADRRPLSVAVLEARVYAAGAEE
jgi:hypothetical protein